MQLLLRAAILVVWTAVSKTLDRQTEDHVHYYGDGDDDGDGGHSNLFAATLEEKTEAISATPAFTVPDLLRRLVVLDSQAGQVSHLAAQAVPVSSPTVRLPPVRVVHRLARRTCRGLGCGPGLPAHSEATSHILRHTQVWEDIGTNDQLADEDYVVIVEDAASLAFFDNVAVDHHMGALAAAGRASRHAGIFWLPPCTGQVVNMLSESEGYSLVRGLTSCTRAYGIFKWRAASLWNELLRVVGHSAAASMTAQTLGDFILNGLPLLLPADHWPVILSLLPRPAPSITGKSRPLRLGFVDFWPFFDASHNIFTILLKSLHNGQHRLLNVTGVDASVPMEGGLDVVIYSPYDVKRYSPHLDGVPKVFYTGENVGPRYDVHTRLNIGFLHRPEDPAYVRLPNWFGHVNWYGADYRRTDNPLLSVTQQQLYQQPAEFVPAYMRRFCAFVVTNPGNPVRNSIFHVLSQYRRVDSAGKLFNNMPDGQPLHATYDTTGGDEEGKIAFLRQYKFCLTYENAASPGYTTEKLLHAKVAGCVPIYWGDPRVAEDFDPAGYIHANNLTEAQVVDRVRQLDADHEAWEAMARTPAMSYWQVQRWRSRLTELGLSIGAVAGISLPDTNMTALGAG